MLSLKKHFSLIELLIVVAIIAILTSLLSPALRKTLESARMVQCMNNCRSVHTAMTLYCDDHAGRFPDYHVYSWTWMGKATYWGTMDVTERPLNEYLGATRDGAEMPGLECPTDESEYHEAPDGSEYSWYEMYGTSYSINRQHNGSLGGGWRGAGPKTLSQVSDPSRMVMVMETDAMIAQTIATFWDYKTGAISASQAAAGNGWAYIDMHNRADGAFSNIVKVDGSSMAMAEMFLRVYDTDDYTFLDFQR